MVSIVETKIANSFEYREIGEIDKVNVNGHYFIHKSTGARILFLLKEDINKSFYVAQRTLPENNKGIPHIIEHSIMSSSAMLGGANIYTELSKRSLCNYINALTYPDKTVYAFSTVDENEYEAIMKVLLEAVYNSNILYTDKYFLQEGINITEDEKGNQIHFGVVYNEMLGSYGSEHRIIRNSIYKSLFPNSPYKYDSGGNPKDIVKLSYEEVKDYYKKNYIPSNSYIYLYGNIDVEKYLYILDDILTNTRNDVQLPISIQLPFKQTRLTSDEFPFNRTKSKDCITVTFNYGLGTSLDKEIYQAYDYIDYFLIKAENSIIKKYFIKNNLCSAVASLFETGIYQPFYSLIFYDVQNITVDELKQEIDKLIKQIVDEGIIRDNVSKLFDKNTIEMLEIKSFGYPLGIHYGLTCLDSWLYDDNAPVSHLDWSGTFETLKKNYREGYFEDIINKTMLNNDYRSIVVLGDKKPKEEIKLKNFEVTFQLPQKVKIEESVLPEEKEGKVKLLHHNIETNEIAYLNFIFDITDICSKELLPVYRLHSILLGSLDTRKYSSSEIQTKINELSGGFRSSIRVYPNSSVEQKVRVAYEIEIKALKSNIEKAVQLVLDIITEPFLQHDRQLESLLQRQRVNNSVYVERRINELLVTRCLSYKSEAGFAFEQAYGIDFYKYFSKVLQDIGNGQAAYYEQLKTLSEEMFSVDRLVVSIIGNEELFGRCSRIINKKLAGMNKVKSKGKKISSELANNVHEAVIHDFKNFNIVLAGKIDDLSTVKYSYLSILKTFINYDYLFPKIRNECGAYGARFSFDYFGNMIFNSSNNSKIDKTLEVMRNISDFILNMDISKEALENNKVGALKKFYRPDYPYEKGRNGLDYYFKGIDENRFIEEQEYILSATEKDIRSVAEDIKEAIQQNNILISGNAELIKNTTEEFLICDCQDIFIR